MMRLKFRRKRLSGGNTGRTGSWPDFSKASAPKVLTLKFARSLAVTGSLSRGMSSIMSVHCTCGSTVKSMKCDAISAVQKTSKTWQYQTITDNHCFWFSRHIEDHIPKLIMKHFFLKNWSIPKKNYLKLKTRQLLNTGENCTLKKRSLDASVRFPREQIMLVINISIERIKASKLFFVSRFSLFSVSFQ